LERRPLSKLAVEPDIATALFHDAEYGREAEPGSLANRLRRERRLEDPRLGVFRDADAGVAHRKEHVATGRGADMLGGVFVREPNVRRLSRGRVGAMSN
jgi:hypothetical protein